MREELAKVLVDSQPFFPADFAPPVGPNYGGLMIRLAWHCSGSFRESDGRGGCDGGRIRFSPEMTWEDNANLDMALRLLEPVKEKFGSSLSWGDLIILAGNTAIETMGGPILGFCGGRVDDADGSASLILGPNEEQEALTPCQSIGLQGQCPAPLGPSTIGLIYVNPAGPVDENGNHGTPAESAVDIRNIFGRMGFDDRETVSLIGGGHAFGKCHGACPNPPCGEPPLVGIGPNTFTSGFEGAWTTRPTTWSNDYFTQLFNFEWELITGPGGAPQWSPTNGVDVLMLTADLALGDMGEDEDYEAISREYAASLSDLERDFMRSWYHLTTGDMGPPERCLGDEVPPPQPFQNALPAFVGPKPDYVPIRTAVRAFIAGDPSNIAAFSNLALNCANTFRQTDYRGGCNGARIRFSPQIDWPTNAGAAEALASLSSIKDVYPEVTSADLIVLAGNVALEEAGIGALPFCGGRVDADNANGSAVLAPRFFPDVPVLSVEDDIIVKGLSMSQGVALFAAPKGRSLSNQYFIDLMAGEGSFTVFEQALLEEPFLPIVVDFIADNDAFLEAYASAWTYMMTADRFEGPTGNACTGVNDTPPTPIAPPTGGDSDDDTGNGGMMMMMMGGMKGKKGKKSSKSRRSLTETGERRTTLRGA